MDRVFLDANVLSSAAYRPGAGLLRLWTIRGIQLLTCGYAVAEARRNLPLAEQLARLDRLLVTVQIELAAHAGPHAEEAELSAKDRPILSAAIHVGATHLLTGDTRHFGKLYRKRIAGVLILRPAEYLAGV